MGRKPLSEEQILQKYGSREAYDRHQAALKKWAAKNPDHSRNYYLANRRRECERTKQYFKDHPEYRARTIENVRRKLHEDPEYRARNKLRISSRHVADRLGIDRKGKNLHHFEPMNRKTFIVLDREKHLLLHRIVGGRNINTTIETIKELLPMLGDVTLVLDGRIASWEDVK